MDLQNRRKTLIEIVCENKVDGISNQEPVWDTITCKIRINPDGTLAELAYFSAQPLDLAETIISTF